jgi:hypothetical protein
MIRTSHVQLEGEKTVDTDDENTREDASPRRRRREAAGRGRHRRIGPGRGPTVHFPNTGPESGPILWRDGHRPIDVLEHRGDGTPIGTANPVGRTEGGIAIWEIVIRGEGVPGRWIVLGREFRPKR